MSFFEHSRFRIVSRKQHPYRHTLEEFTFSHPSLPNDIDNVAEVINWILDVLYPRNKPSVATPADLPTGVDTPNLGDVTPSPSDYRVVNDDGDGKAASYMWAKWDGDAVYSWQKVMDIDWGINTVLQELDDRTQPLYVMKRGTTDYDLGTELPYAGDLAGQRIYGGALANEHLILYANNGDAAGNSGFVQFGDNVRPLLDGAFSLGTATYRFSDFRSVLATIGNLSIGTDQLTSSTGQVDFDNENLLTTGNIDGAIITASSSLVVDDTVNQLNISSGSITDTTGAISFGDENLSTTGTINSADITVDGALVLSAGSITDTSGTINFGDENLTTTGNITGAIGSFAQLDVDNLRLDGNTISSQDVNGAIILAANGVGVVDVNSPLETLNITTIGTVDITGQLDVDNLTLNGATINSDTNVITFNSSLLPDGDNTRALGGVGAAYSSLYLQTDLRDSADIFLIAELMELKSASYRDVARTQPAQTGDALFYDAVNDLWLASVPDTEIDHGALAGIGDDDHTQYALLAGRTGGQTLNGSDTTTETLTLINNSVDVDGIVLDIDGIKPNQNGVYDLGDASANYDDLYMVGEGIGFRADNRLQAALAALASGTTAGRLVYSTDNGFLQVDNGGVFVKVNNKGYNQTKTDVELMAAIDVSASVDDARNCIWQLCDVANAEEVMAVSITKTATLVTVSVDIPLPAGNYRLIGIQVN